MSEFNADELQPPTWLNKDFFQMVLRNYEKDDTILINKLNITPGSGKGDHLASIMFRAVAEYSTTNSTDSNSRSMIVKTIPEAEGFKKQFLEGLTIFDTEIRMYSETVPKFEEVLRKYGDNTQLCSKILYHSLKPRKVVVFEDLVPLDYICLRDRFFDVDEVKASLRKIAKWHAVSYKLASEGDESIKAYEHGLLSKPKDELPPFLTRGCQLFIDAISKVHGLEIYAEKLQAIEAILIPKCNEIFQAYKRGHKGIMVLNHGDFHGRNIMLKFDANNKLDDIMLIDFQISFYGPAIVDIIYCIYMILNEDLRENHREELIHYYFSLFVETLQKIEYVGELPTLSEFYIDWHKFKEYEIWCMTTFLPLVHSVMTGSEPVETEDLISSSDCQSLMYFNPSYINEIKRLLPKLLYTGFLG